MLRLIGRVMSALAAVCVIAGSALAQRPGGQPTLSFMTRVRQWTEWSNENPHFYRLQCTLRCELAVEQDPATRLNHAQAQRLLRTINQWRGKTALTDAQAATAARQLAEPLSPAQLKALHNDVWLSRFGRLPRAPVGHSGPMAFSQMPAPIDYNPLNPSTIPKPWERETMQLTLTTLIGLLKAS